MKTFLELYDDLKEKSKGLYYNINKKRKEGRPMRKNKGSREGDFGAQTAKEQLYDKIGSYCETDETHTAKQNGYCKSGQTKEVRWSDLNHPSYQKVKSKMCETGKKKSIIQSTNPNCKKNR